MATDDDAETGGNDSADSLVPSRESVDLLPPTPKIDLRDPHAVRRELGAVYRDMRTGRIAPADGTRLAYVLGQLLRAFETTELQDRLEALERTISQRTQDHAQQGPNRKAV